MARFRNRFFTLVLLTVFSIVGNSTEATSARTKSTSKKPHSTKPTVKPMISTPTTIPGPRSFSLATGALTEASGCAILKSDPNTVWLHNDSGDTPRLFALDLLKKRIRSVDVTGDVEARDWEDIAPVSTGGVLIGDIGDNDAVRKSVNFYRVRNLSGESVTAERQTLHYEDGSHNAEALLVDPASPVDSLRVYVITKEPTGISGVYRAEGDDLRKTGTITISGEGFLFPNLITAADALPDGSGFILRTYQYAYLFKRATGQPFETSFAAKPTQISLPLLPQAESLCVFPDGKTALTTTESRGADTISFVTFDLPRAA